MANCIPAGKTAKGKLKPGYRWAKGQKACPIKSKKAKSLSGLRGLRGLRGRLGRRRRR